MYPIRIVVANGKVGAWMFDRRQSNINIFTDTERMCRTDKKLIDVIHKSNERQILIRDEDDTNKQINRYEEPAKIVVSKKRSLEAAEGYKGMKICVHNFASATNPGGGVTKGSNAQEEAICRCSTLYFNISNQKISNEFHTKHRSLIKMGKMTSLYNDDCIYTPGVCVFKSDTSLPELLPENKWYEVDVITCAAPNLRERPSNPMNPSSGMIGVKIRDKELLELHIKRMSRICDIAVEQKEDVLILGAFGCGAFCNSPRVVAEAMARVVEKYRYSFKVFEFAVYCTSRDTENYEVFSKRLGR